MLPETITITRVWPYMRSSRLPLCLHFPSHVACVSVCRAGRQQRRRRRTGRAPSSRSSISSRGSSSSYHRWRSELARMEQGGGADAGDIVRAARARQKQFVTALRRAVLRHARAYDAVVSPPLNLNPQRQSRGNNRLCANFAAQGAGPQGVQRPAAAGHQNRRRRGVHVTQVQRLRGVGQGSTKPIFPLLAVSGSASS
jgi:hypothetical protein